MILRINKRIVEFCTFHSIEKFIFGKLPSSYNFKEHLQSTVYILVFQGKTISPKVNVLNIFCGPWGGNTWKCHFSLSAIFFKLEPFYNQHTLFNFFWFEFLHYPTSFAQVFIKNRTIWPKNPQTKLPNFEVHTHLWSVQNERQTSEVCSN